MKLEFGGGETPKTSFKQVDIRDCGHTDFVCNAWEIVDYISPETVTEIYSRHFLEHLTFNQAWWTLEAWYTIMCSKGLLTIIVPDLNFHIDQWKEGKFDEAIQGFWGKQRDSESMWDVHKSGYCYSTLGKLLSAIGFHSIERIKDLPKNLTITAMKP